MSIRGIADSHLDCYNTLLFMFATWEKVKAYYRICFEAGCVCICKPQTSQTPIHSPVHKKTKVLGSSSRFSSRAPPQPNFGMAMKPNTPLRSPSTSSDARLPLVFCDSPSSLARPVNGDHKTLETASSHIAELAKYITVTG